MKIQWNILWGIIFALIVAVFAVINVEPVSVNYLFGKGEWPLILVILISVLLGGLIIGSAGIIRIYTLQRKIKTLEKEKKALEQKTDGKKEKEKVLTDPK